MRTIHIFFKAFCAIFIILLLQSCTKQDAKIVAQQKNKFDNSSLVQFYFATVNASRNYISVDGKSLNGSALSSGSVFPSGTGAIGSDIAHGLRAFFVRDTLATTTQLPLSFAANLQAAKYYTVFLYDSINAPKQKTVETSIVVPGDSTARLRFANFVYSTTAVPSVDIFSKRRNINIFTNVAISDVTNFIPVPSAFNDTFFVRETGTTNQLAVLNGLNPTQKRSYTLVFRGRYLSTSGTVARTLSSFTNY